MKGIEIDFGGAAVVLEIGAGRGPGERRNLLSSKARISRGGILFFARLSGGGSGIVWRRSILSGVGQVGKSLPRQAVDF